MEKLYCVEHSNATVLPVFPFGMFGQVGGAYSNGKPIFEALSPCQVHSHDACYQAPYVAAQKYINKDVICCGVLSPHFGHFICESLSRLWFAKKHPDMPIVWTFETSYKPWQEEILDLLAIKNPPIFVGDKPVEFKKLYTPIPGFIHENSFHPEHADFLACYESQEPIKGKKVYVSKSKFPGAGYVNEKDIEDFLKNHGWIIFQSELHSIQDKLDMLSSAEIVLGLESSAFHSLIFHKNIKSKIFCLHRVGSPTCQLIPSVKKIQYSTINLTSSNIDNASVTNSDLMHPFIKSYICDTKKLFAYFENTNFLENIKPADFINSDYMGVINTSYKECVQKADNITSQLIDGFYMGSYCMNKNDLLEAEKYLQLALTEQEDLQEKKVQPNKIVIDNINVFLTQQDFLQAQQSCVFAKLARLYELQNNLDKAIFYADKSMHKMSQYSARILHYSSLLRKNGEFETAISLMHEAIKLISYDGRPYTQLALIYENMGELDEAIVWAYKAVEIAPHHFQTRLLLVNLLCKNNDFQSVIDLMLEGMKPVYNVKENTLPTIYNAEHELDEIISFVLKSTQDNPKNVGTNFFLANLLRKKGDYDSAIALLEETMNLEPFSGESHAQFALLYHDKGEINKAIEWLQKGVKLEPKHLGRKKMLAKLLKQIR